MIPYYERNGITIYCGDCLEVMPQLDMMFDAIICDPPYGTTACAWDIIIPFEPLWENYKRLVKGNGAVVLFGSQPFTSKLVMSNLDWFKYEWIWDKVSSSEWHSGAYRPLLSHENIIIFSGGTCANGGKMPMNYNPQLIKRTSNRSGTFGLNSNKYKNPKGIKRKPIKKTLTHRFPVSLITCSNASRNDISHPTQKPVALLAYLICTYTNPGDLILDNAMGSGTTLVAAQNEGRRAVGIETNEDYVKIAVDRLRQPSFFSISDKPKLQGGQQLAMEVGP
jgi:site-specific DNA-methyltransferase (adenine-specific)